MGDLLHFQVHHRHGRRGFGEKLGQGGTGGDDLHLTAHAIVGLDQRPHQAEAHNVVGADNGLGHVVVPDHLDAQLVARVDVVLTVEGAGVDVHAVLLAGLADGAGALVQAQVLGGIDDQSDVGSRLAHSLLRRNAAGGILVDGHAGVTFQHAVVQHHGDLGLSLGQRGQIPRAGGDDDGRVVYAAGPEVVLQIEIIGLVGADGQADGHGVEQDG